MIKMEGSSNSQSASARIHDFEYLYASNTNISNFISLKLSGNSNYLLWKAQMLCLLESNNLCGVVDDTIVGPRDSTMKQYDSLVKGWIFGSVSEDVLVCVLNLNSAKAVWEKLKSMYDPSICLRQDSTLKKSETQTKDEEGANSIENTNVASSETNTLEEGANSIKIIVGDDTTETQKRDEDMQESEEMIDQKKEIRKATIKGNWLEVKSLITQNEDLATKAISRDGTTILHIAVGIGHNEIVKNLIMLLSNKDILAKKDDGSTPLHIAAIVGNKDAADLLVKKNRESLRAKDLNGEEPLHKAYENMHLATIGCLLQAKISDDDKTKVPDSVHPREEIAVDQVLVNAISAKQYSLASKLVKSFPEFASKSDDVLVAIAKTFPSGLDYGEALIYPSWRIVTGMYNIILDWIGIPLLLILLLFIKSKSKKYSSNVYCDWLITMVLATVPGMLLFVLSSMCIIMIAVCSIIDLIYLTWWNLAKNLIASLKHIEKKKYEWDKAKKLLELVCDEIDKVKYHGTQHPYYTRPVLEAACHNAYQVVDEILFRSPETINSTDRSGYDIIHLAIINRSEKIYNLIYDIGERKNLYRTYRDSSQNNILHLAGKLAPARVLNKITGAALQLQRELQWREEVKKFVFPTYITQENISEKTPDMLFTTEHTDLVKEGENWMKTTAESCSITAALIITIVFAAAITVPGGSNQEKGTPLFKNKIPFIIFAISDAISLFASSTALLVFLSILTARFAEKDFLVSLPRRLFIGLFALILSTTAMMVAFSATLFLVFCDEQLWMLAPICGLAFIPIAFFVGLQFPLMVDLFRSTYVGIFGKKGIPRKFNKDEIRLHIGTNIGAITKEKSKKSRKTSKT